MRSAETTTNSFDNWTVASELNSKPNKEKTKFSGFNFSFIESLTNLFEPKVKLWSSKRYVETALLNKANLTEAKPKILNELRPDIKSFLDEYAAFLPMVTYEYGVNGMQNGYSQSMTEIAEHHLQEQSLKGLPTERAQMEVHVARAIENWMQTEDLPIGARIMAVSPRGSRQEGYPGHNKKNYVFVNVFEKTETGFVLRQYRSYDTNAQLAELQAKMLFEQSCSLKYATTQDQQRQDLNIINSLIAIAPETKQAAIESLIYANKEQWAVDVDTELPKLDGTAYPQILAETVDFCVAQFSELISEDSFSEADSERFTLLVTTVKESLIKWVETHATNYDSKQAAHTVDFDQILQVWQTRCAEADGTKLTKEQKSVLSEFKQLTELDPTLPLKSLSSWAHCIVGSPASLLKLQNVDLMNAMQANQLNQAQLAELIGKDRAALWSNGTCLRCGDSCLVGECSICMRCELELGGQLPSDSLSSAEAKFIDSLPESDKNEAQKLFAKFSKLVLRETVSFEQLLHGDFIKPTAAANEELEPYLDRLFYAPNGLSELKIIVHELSTKKDTIEHKNNGSEILKNSESPLLLAA